MRLPDPTSFDPVRFPESGEPGAWPPPAFDFASPWLSTPDLAFERGADGQIVFVRRCVSLRMLLDIETAHSALDVVPGSHDFRLLRLIPSALRFVETVSPRDPVPPALRGGCDLPVGEHHLYGAACAVVAALEEGVGPLDAPLLAALRRAPPGPGMFEWAAVRCVAQGGFAPDQVARTARRLRQLAQAHAEVLAAHATGPDFAGMERAVAGTARVLARDAGWSGDLIALVVRQLSGVIATPREASDRLLAEAQAALAVRGEADGLARLTDRQARLRDRLVEIGVFWRRCAAAWASVHPETTDRRDIDALSRNALRRLSLAALYEAVPA